MSIDTFLQHFIWQGYLDRVRLGDTKFATGKAADGSLPHRAMETPRRISKCMSGSGGVGQHGEVGAAGGKVRG